MPKTLLSWSSGKDSAWALHVLRGQGIHVGGLLTTINCEFDRVAMHAVRRTLLEAQADAARLPLYAIPLPWPCSNQDYENIMAETCRTVLAQGFDTIAFGDLYLADVREYRERQLRDTGLTPVFPLWHMPTGRLARDMIEAGMKARITCVDPRLLSRDFAGRDFDVALLADLPDGVDPCGERGEFHSFAYAGPMFEQEIPVVTGETVERDGFVFADLTLPGSS